MNKVAKEQLGLFKPKKVEVFPFDLSSLDFIHSLMEQNEQKCFMSLGKKMMAAGKGDIFDVWMLKHQDMVQAAAHAYGERIVSSSLLNAISSNAEAASTLTSIYRLHALNTIQNNLAEFVISGMLTLEQGEAVRTEFDLLCDEVSSIAPEICDAFGI